MILYSTYRKGSDKMKSKTCCFSGHRNIPADKEEEIRIKLIEELEKLINKGYRFFAAGGALGFDTMAAIEVLNLRRKYPHIKLIMVLPCKDQSKYWNKADKNIYEFIKKQSDKWRERRKSACMPYLHNSRKGKACQGRLLWQPFILPFTWL